jgi:hypothetical protein
MASDNSGGCVTPLLSVIAPIVAALDASQQRFFASAVPVSTDS